MKKTLSAVLALLVFLTVFAFAGTKRVTYYYGDVNLDFHVTSGDARSVLRVSAKLDPPFNEKKKKIADVDRDGSITSIDARIILRMSAKLEELVKIEDKEEPSTDNGKEPTTNSSDVNKEKRYPKPIDAFLNSRYRLKGVLHSGGEPVELDFATNGKDLRIQMDNNSDKVKTTSPVSVLVIQKKGSKNIKWDNLYFLSEIQGEKRYCVINQKALKLLNLGDLSVESFDFANVKTLKFTREDKKREDYSIYVFGNDKNSDTTRFHVIDGNLMRIDILDESGQIQSFIDIKEFIYGKDLSDSYFTRDGYRYMFAIVFFSKLFA